MSGMYKEVGGVGVGGGSRVGRYTSVSVLSRYLQWTIIVSQPILHIAIYRPTRFIEENTVYC